MKLWKFFQGYVKICIVGKYPEKLVNRCLESGAELWNVQRQGRAVFADTSMADMKRLHGLSRGCGCRVRIVEKSGLAARLLRLRHSLRFCLLLTAFSLALALASTRLWFVDIKSESVPKEQAAAALAELGAVPGAARRSVRTSDIARVLNSLPGVANAKAVLSGVVLSIELSEKAEQPIPGAAEAQGDIFAERDCVISYISVTSGQAAVSAGQAVKKGDVLITGDLTHLKEGYRVPAQGVVYGMTVRRFSASAEAEREAPVRSGRSRTAVAARLLGRDIFLESPFEAFELELVSMRAVTASPVPLAVCEYRAYELVPGSVRDSDEETERRALLAAQEKLAAGVPEEAKITSVKSFCYKSEGGVTAVLTVTTIEPIGVTHN